jgi:hypothetical protein
MKKANITLDVRFFIAFTADSLRGKRRLHSS